MLWRCAGSGAMSPMSGDQKSSGVRSWLPTVASWPLTCEAVAAEQSADPWRDTLSPAGLLPGAPHLHFIKAQQGCQALLLAAAAAGGPPLADVRPI
jgi:hypothetical protein